MILANVFYSADLTYLTETLLWWTVGMVGGFSVTSVALSRGWLWRKRR